MGDRYPEKDTHRGMRIQKKRLQRDIEIEAKTSRLDTETKEPIAESS